MAIFVPSKSVHRHARTAFKRFIHETGSAHTVLQVDDEPAIKALARALASEIDSHTMRMAPVGSQSQGVAERAHQTLFAQVKPFEWQML